MGCRLSCLNKVIVADEAEAKKFMSQSGEFKEVQRDRERELEAQILALSSKVDVLQRQLSSSNGKQHHDEIPPVVQATWESAQPAN